MASSSTGAMRSPRGNCATLPPSSIPPSSIAPMRCPPKRAAPRWTYCGCCRPERRRFWSCRWERRARSPRCSARQSPPRRSTTRCPSRNGPPAPGASRCPRSCVPVAMPSPLPMPPGGSPMPTSRHVACWADRENGCSAASSATRASFPPISGRIGSRSSIPTPRCRRRCTRANSPHGRCRSPGVITNRCPSSDSIFRDSGS